MFQVCHVNAPADLDERLQRRGYRLQEPCTALAKSIAPDAAAGHDRGHRDRRRTERGLALGLSRRHHAEPPRPRAHDPGARAAPRARSCCCAIAGEPAATALGVVAEGVAIAECVMTRADRRRRAAAASRVMRALEAWGARQGATIAALQAVAANAPAQGLYAKLAYARVGGYHYRVLDT